MTVWASEITKVSLGALNHLAIYSGQRAHGRTQVLLGDDFLPKQSIELNVAALAILASTVAVVLGAAPPASAFVVTAVFPPWWSAEDVRRVVTPIGVAASSGRTPNVVTVYGATRLQFQLRQAGVWLILDPRVLACGTSSDLS